MKAIARDQGQRYQSMGELAKDLTAYLKGDTQPHETNTPREADETAESGNVKRTMDIDAEEIDFLRSRPSKSSRASSRHRTERLRKGSSRHQKSSGPPKWIFGAIAAAVGLFPLPRATE